MDFVPIKLHCAMIRKYPSLAFRVTMFDLKLGLLHINRHRCLTWFIVNFHCVTDYIGGNVSGNK